MALSNIEKHYNKHPEDLRLQRRHGIVEFETTMHHLRRFIKPDSLLLDIGAGTGRYTSALMAEGYRVKAVELVRRNIEVFLKREPTADVVQGDARNMPFLPTAYADVTLLLGPLIIAILIGRFGYRMKLVTYTTTSANMMLREIGLVLFLASVGIKAGAGFWDTVVQGDGLKYVGCGFLITIIPILIVGTIARLKFKFNYFTIMGMIAGTYTDPPALAYANASCSKEAPAVGYSTVYPLSMFLRIFTAQIVVLFFC